MNEYKRVAEALDEALRVRDEVIPNTAYPTATELALVVLAEHVERLQERLEEIYYCMDDE